MKKSGRLWILPLGLLVLLTLGIGGADARTKIRTQEEIKTSQNYKLSSVFPQSQQRTHRVGYLQLCVTNWGIFGSQMRDPATPESRGGCFMSNPDEEIAAPSAEYPAGSEICSQMRSRGKHPIWLILVRRILEIGGSL